MVWVLAIGAAWLALALAVGVLIGRAVRVADLAAAEAAGREPRPEDEPYPEPPAAADGAPPPAPDRGPEPDRGPAPDPTPVGGKPAIPVARPPALDRDVAPRGGRRTDHGHDAA